MAFMIHAHNDANSSEDSEKWKKYTRYSKSGRRNALILGVIMISVYLFQFWFDFRTNETVIPSILNLPLFIIFALGFFLWKLLIFLYLLAIAYHASHLC